MSKSPTKIGLVDRTTPEVTEDQINATRADGTDAWFPINGKLYRTSDLLRVLVRALATARSSSAIPLRLQLEAERVAVERMIATTPAECVLDLASARARLAKIESDLSALTLPPSSREQ